VCLSDRGLEFYLGRLSYATGFGNIKKSSETYFSYTLKQVRMPLLAGNVCKKLYPGLNVNTQICAGWKYEKDTSFGDSGGPLVALVDQRWHLVGITSYGEEGPSELCFCFSFTLIFYV